MTQHWGIRTKILLIALLPTALIATTLGSYFIIARHDDLKTSLVERGNSLAFQLAYASELGVYAGNTRALQHLLETTQAQHKDLLTAVIYDQRGQVLASAGSKSLITKINIRDISRKNYANENDQQYLFSTPIVSQDSFSKTNPQTDSTTLKEYLGQIVLIFSKDAILLRQFQSLTAGLFILFFGVFISGFLAQRLTRHVTRPIIQLTKTVDDIKEGKLDTPVVPNASGEIRVLQAGIAAMTKSLKSARDEMQSHIERATSELRGTLKTIEEQNTDLDNARKEALEANRVKSEFLANMSHEIRTPMNSVIGFTQLLLKTPLDARQKDYLQTISRSAEGLLAIIDDILDFTKIEAGKMLIDKSNVDLRECVEQIMSLLAPQAHSKNIELIPFIYSDVPKNLIGDALRIKQILTNLINNAIKFTEAGSVVVRVMLEDEGANTVTIGVSVTDTGIGLSKEQKQRLFEAFSQADTTTTRRFGGTGLGLVISKKLVEKMGGEIGLESEVGKGSTFWFTFVCELAAKTELEENKYDLLANRNVVFYDRNEKALQSITHLLSAWSMNCRDFQDQQKFVGFLRNAAETQKDINIVLVGGIRDEDEAWLKELTQLCHKELDTYVIQFVNTTEQNYIDHYLQLGVDLCLSKPVISRALLEALQDGIVRVKPPKLLIEESRQSGEEPRLEFDANILAVDDNPANLKLISILLEDMGAKVSTAVDGQEAIDYAKATLFDLILMDVQMPKVDGVKATQLIRQDTVNKQTPIVALTAHAMEGEKAELIKAGMDDYLTKPISQHDLQTTLALWLGRQKSLSKQATGYAASATETLPKAADKQSTPTIDWPLCLKMANNKADLAEDMLEMLVKTIPETQKLIKDAFKAGDMDALLKHVHKFHGATCYTGVPALKQLADRLETNLKSKNFDQLEKLIDDFLKKMEQVSQESAQFFN